jgi:hypothetical protein
MDNSEIVEIKKDSQQKLDEDLSHYREVIYMMGANVSIKMLCLPVQIENILLHEGYDRVYMLTRNDLTKIKGLGKRRLALLTSRLDELFSILM